MTVVTLTSFCEIKEQLNFKPFHRTISGAGSKSGNNINFHFDTE